MTAPRKRGRPPFLWHGPKGQTFLYAVFVVQSDRHPIKIVDAINIVLKMPEFEHFNKYNLRYLEKKYQDIANSNPYSRLHKEYRRAEYLIANYRDKV